MDCGAMHSLIERKTKCDIFIPSEDVLAMAITREASFPSTVTEALSHLSSACLSLALILTVIGNPSQAFLSDDTGVSLTPFDLTYTPAHVVKGLTRNINLLCAHQNDNQSQLQEITRIRLLKKTASVWTLLAELRDNEDEPQTMFGGTVSAKISPDIRETFLQITWSLATEETFGTYRCVYRFQFNVVTTVKMTRYHHVTCVRMTRR
ncbi:hypothetical protein PoB_007439400 [Plakobranchus ocellatus]|uniref:SUN domain-containing protein n=1 Tax=Plakobranchus ocellatus TaxID=259542 RepID=A0AAV4DUH7_9GAST|nr:hypothetical protein PoB_007439400 [Plakobranchus ocellatus]